MIKMRKVNLSRTAYRHVAKRVAETLAYVQQSTRNHNESVPQNHGDVLSNDLVDLDVDNNLGPSADVDEGGEENMNSFQDGKDVKRVHKEDFEIDFDSINVPYHNRYQEEPPQTIAFKELLANWAIDEEITLKAVSSLLKILRETSEPLDNLPKDARTLLNTPSHLNNVIFMGTGGSFYYFGIENSINFLFRATSNMTGIDKIDIAVNVDGLPLSKSSNSSFWPILGQVKNVQREVSSVFLIGLYHGYEKPPANELMRDFVNESINLCTNGISINNCTYPFQVYMLICDTPAKSLILNIKPHTGYFSCTKCCEEGDLINYVMCFVEHGKGQHARKRTDLSFRLREQPEHHLSDRSVMEEIPKFDMIKNVPLDYMHLVLLGVFKRLLCNKKFGWIHGKAPHKLRGSHLMLVNIRLLELKRFIPCEYSRKTRLINEIKRYKAVELRMLLLLTGSVVFKDILPSRKYNHYLTLAVAITIMASDKYIQNVYLLDYAEQLLNCFVLNCICYYGNDFVTYNVHNLLHLRECVDIFGPLDVFSAFPFENYMQVLKHKVRKQSQPLQQVVKRMIEIQKHGLPNDITKHKKQFSLCHSAGPLAEGTHSPQYKKFETEIYTLSVKTAADCFVKLDNGDIFEIHKFASKNEHKVIIGLTYSCIGNFFTKPCDSSLLDIFCISPLDETLRVWPIEFIRYKVAVLPFKQQRVCFPILHIT